jgi:hypothetical protein
MRTEPAYWPTNELAENPDQTGTQTMPRYHYIKIYCIVGCIIKKMTRKVFRVEFKTCNRTKTVLFYDLAMKRDISSLIFGLGPFPNRGH